MFATLHGAFGTWPSDSSHRRPGERGILGGSGLGLNERLDFDEEAEAIPSAASVFVLRPELYPSGRVFIPPYFVPPEGLGRQSGPAVQAPSEEDHDFVDRNGLVQDEVDATDPRANTASVGILVSKSFHWHFDHPGPNMVPPQYPESFAADETPRPESLAPYGADIQRGREANWSDGAREAFNTMIHAPVYVNRYRLSSEKYTKILAYLRDPEMELLCDDGSKDHQTRYQAAHWVVQNGRLYKKADHKGLKGLRRHLGLVETWEVLTAEHIRSGHLGRDRLRKILEKHFIGYTLQEIMFVLRECKRCNGSSEKTTTPLPARSPEQSIVPTNSASSGRLAQLTGQPIKITAQTSNFMMY